MIIYELSIDDLNASRLFFPIEGQEEHLLKLTEEKITNGISVKDEWEDFIILKKDPKIDVDFYDIEDSGIVILSPRAYQLISPLMNDTVETLRLRSDDGDYYLLNVVETTDCLNRKNSDFTGLESGQIMDFRELSFISKNITCPVFRIPEMPYKTMITDQIMELYYTHEMKGLNLTEEEFIWNEY